MRWTTRSVLIFTTAGIAFPTATTLGSLAGSDCAGERTGMLTAHSATRIRLTFRQRSIVVEIGLVQTAAAGFRSKILENLGADSIRPGFSLEPQPNTEKNPPHEKSIQQPTFDLRV